MSLQKQINEDWKASMKSRDVPRKNVLTYLRAEIKTRAINDRSDSEDAPDEIVIKVIKRLIKQRQEALVAVEEGNLSEDFEIQILGSYLAHQELITGPELKTLVSNVLDEFGRDPKHFGKVMGALMSKYKDKIDGTEARNLIQEQIKATS